MKITEHSKTERIVSGFVSLFDEQDHIRSLIECKQHEHDDICDKKKCNIKEWKLKNKISEEDLKEVDMNMIFNGSLLTNEKFSKCIFKICSRMNNNEISDWRDIELIKEWARYDNIGKVRNI